jgi:hypothetical protein
LVAALPRCVLSDLCGEMLPRIYLSLYHGWQEKKATCRRPYFLDLPSVFNIIPYG